uniref:Uncharacterized protein n=1 Tax=Noccaea caerulescens TaxID=107243 RepID=A0A1J3FSU8_NOCCA
MAKKSLDYHILITLKERTRDGEKRSIEFETCVLASSDSYDLMHYRLCSCISTKVTSIIRMEKKDDTSKTISK